MPILLNYVIDPRIIYTALLDILSQRYTNTLRLIGTIGHVENEIVSIRSSTHGNVFLRFCIFSSNELVVLDFLANSKQYKNAGKRFRVYGGLISHVENEIVSRIICGLISFTPVAILPSYYALKPERNHCQDCMWMDVIRSMRTF